MDDIQLEKKILDIVKGIFINKDRLKLSLSQRNKLYYERNKENHIKNVKAYAQLKNEKQHCDCCNCDVLKIKFNIHCKTKKHLKNSV